MLKEKKKRREDEQEVSLYKELTDIEYVYIYIYVYRVESIMSSSIDRIICLNQNVPP